MIGVAAAAYPWMVWPLTLFVGMITPGPGNLSVVAIAAARGPGPAAAWAAGLGAGDMCLAVMVVAGSAHLAADPWIGRLMTLGGGLALVVIGVRMLIAPTADEAEVGRKPGRLPNAAGGLLLALSNPKALLLHAAAAPALLAVAAPGPNPVLVAAVVGLLNLLALAPYLLLARLAGPCGGRFLRRAAPRIGGGVLILAGAALLSAWLAVES